MLHAKKRMTRILKNIVFYALTILLPSYSFGQTQTKEIKVGGFELQASTVDPELNALFISVGELPVFPGGVDSLFAFAKRNLYYPETAIRDSLQGRVMLQFSVDTSGKVIDEKIKFSVRIDLDTLCLSMLRKMPKWETGKLEGRAVAVQFFWPIKFTLIKKDDE
jgi:TonB family protein